MLSLEKAVTLWTRFAGKSKGRRPPPTAEKRQKPRGWEGKVIAVDLVGVFLCAREAAVHMIEGGRGGVIINISSISRAGNIGQTNYAAARRARNLSRPRASSPSAPLPRGRQKAGLLLLLCLREPLLQHRDKRLSCLPARAPALGALAFCGYGDRPGHQACHQDALIGAA
jgi:hypothetical protein